MTVDTSNPDDQETREERRKFVNLLFGGALSTYLLALPMAMFRFLAGGGAGRRRAQPLKLGPVSDLLRDRSYRKVKLGDKTVTILRLSDGRLRAVNSRCTHAGCSVEWQPRQDRFRCHCHGGEFFADGTVARVPPTEALEVLTLVERDGEVILIDKPSES